ncbi:MAG: Holliday junction resolvase RuvX, partial [Gammaproteobacteria bacterium]
MPGTPEKPLAAAPVTVLAFDFGTRNIGMAVGQTLTVSARPLTVLRAKDGK